MVAPGGAHVVPQGRPVEGMLAADLGERGVDAALHLLVTAEVDERVVVAEQPRGGVAARAHAVLHVLLGLLRIARERELHVDQFARQLHQRTEVRQLARRACAEEEQVLAALLERHAAALGHGAHGRRAGAGAYHDQVGARVVRHQEARAVGTGDAQLVAALQVAQVVRGDAAHRRAVPIGGDSLHRERDVVVAGTFAVARAGDRVKAHVMRQAAGVRARHQYAERLPLEHREGAAAEIEHDVVDVAARVLGGEAIIAGHRGGHRLGDRVQADVGMCRRPRRRRGAALTLVRDLGKPCDLRRDVAVGRERIPRQLLLQGIRLRHAPPAVDRAGRAGRDAVAAVVALVRQHDVVAIVVRDRVDRAGLLAGIAANADLRIDQVLADKLGGLRHGGSQLKRTYSKSTDCLLMPESGGAIQLANLPGSVTRPMSECTKARSSSEGSQSLCRWVHSASEITLPSGLTCRSPNRPIRRWKPLYGSLKRNGTPDFSGMRFQRSIAFCTSTIQSSRSRSFSAVSAGTCLAITWSSTTSGTSYSAASSLWSSPSLVSSKRPFRPWV